MRDPVVFRVCDLYQYGLLSSALFGLFRRPVVERSGEFGLCVPRAPGYCRHGFNCLYSDTLRLDVAMLSARNQLPATIKSIKLGNVMAEVIMSVGDVEIVSAITRGSAEQLGLKAGDAVKAVIKATEVLIDKS